MQAEIRRKLTMAARALNFAQAHPSTDASYTTLVARLQDRLAHANALAVQQTEGTTDERAATAQRDVLRRTIQRIQLRHLVALAAMASRDHPELLGKFVNPKPRASLKAVIAAAQALVAAATPHKDLFVSLGLSGTFLDELTQSIAQFDQVTEDGYAGRRAHVGARAELLMASDDCVKLVGLLDGVCQIRFRTDAESLAAWESSKSGAGPIRPKQAAPAPSPAPVDPAAKPAGPDQASVAA
jgi:hypothetical protein